MAIVWGVTVVADSAQFSTAVSELAPPGTAGSALSVQTAAGFMLTGVTILRSACWTRGRPGWRMASRCWPSGRWRVVAMWRLRRRPEAVRMASGNR